jgi:hypothetical protein
VDLGGCYSNPKALEATALAAQAIDGIKIDSPRPSPSPAAQRWRLLDRLGEQIVNDLLEDRRLGMTNLRLVEQYSISLSSVKRILKRARGT